MPKEEKMIQSEESSKKIEWWHGLVGGSAAGVADATINYPWTSLRIMMQSKQKLQYKPTALYRGVVQYASSIIPTTVIQFTLDAALSGYSDKNSWKFGAAFLGGMGGAIVSTPSEHVIFTQQKLSVGPTKAFKALCKNQGWQRPWTGLCAKSIRDGGYAAAMLWGQNVTCEWLNKNTPIKNTSGIPYSDFLAGIVSGTVGAVMTQPFDVISTLQQCNQQSLSMYNVSKNIYRESKLKGFFVGLTFRTLSVVSGVIVMSYAKKEIEKMLEKKPQYNNNRFFRGVLDSMPKESAKAKCEFLPRPH